MGIYIAAAITSALALGGFAMLLPRAKDWRPLVLALIVVLPLQPLVFYAIRMPIDGTLRTNFGIAVGWVTIVSMFYAPLLEEPAKWLAAAVPAIRRAIRLDPVRLALVVGVGFGIGEIWFLANAIAWSPSVPDLPFWQFSGFMIERFAVCFLHGAFLAPPFYALARGRSFLLGGLAGMVLHFLLNFPIFLAQIGAFGISPKTWPMLLVSWIFWCVVGCVVLVVYLSDRFKRLRSSGQSGVTPP